MFVGMLIDARVSDGDPRNLGRVRHAPAHHRQLAAVARVAHNGGRVVRESARHRRQVADIAVAECGDSKDNSRRSRHGAPAPIGQKAQPATAGLSRKAAETMTTEART
jgi:hypothetical protein